MSHHGCICMPRFLSGSLHLPSIPAVSWGEQLGADHAKGTKRDMGFGATPFRHWALGPWSPSQIDGLNERKDGMGNMTILQR